MSAKRFVILSLCLVLVLGFYAKTTLGANILYIANLRDEGFIQKDKIIQDYMRGLGHTVIPFDDQESEAATEAAAQAADIDLVYISETVGSGGIKNEITEIDVPMIIGEPWAWDEMGLDTGGGGGNDVTTTDITIVSPGHPLAAGLTGTVAVLTDIGPNGAFARFARCFVGGDGTAIATWNDAGTIKDVLMVYEKGDRLAKKPADGSSIIAANIRIGIGFDERSFELWNDNAFLLLEAAINYIVRDRDSAQVVNPFDGETDVDSQTVCTWTPGETAETHDVYFGTDFSDVNEASRTDTREALKAQAQEPNSFDPGLLALGTTYYWRVDEVKAAPDSTVSKGTVWSFTVEPYSIVVQSIVVTASSQDPEFPAENTINGSGLDEADLHGVDATTMWLSNVGDPAVWIQYAFDRAYKLDKMLVWNSNQELELAFGLGVKEVTLEVSTNGTDWTVLENVQHFAQAPGVAGYAANTIIDFNGAMIQFVKISVNSGYGTFLGRYGLSEVRFFYIPTFATRPNPQTGATDVAPDVMLTWGRDGREAGSHDVYVGSNPDDLTLAGTVSESSFDTLALDLQLSETYSWRVDEVNEAMDPSTWIGEVWSFTTADAISIDGMESYEDVESLEIWATWIDGYGVPANGSLVGNGITGTPETDLVHGGSQSLPMHYDNSAAAQSEATLTFDAPMDWAGHGVQGLVLYFQGRASNTGGSLYVKINGTKVAFDGDPAALMRGGWNKWYIPLADVAGNLSGVTSLTIGIDSGGMGVVYVDDILLTDDARELVTPVDPGSAGLLAHYALDGNAMDSSGNGNHGAIVGNPQWVALGQIGGALEFVDGAGDYVDLGNPPILDQGTNDWTVSAWVKVASMPGDDMIIFSKGGDGGGGIRYEMLFRDNNNGDIKILVDDDGSGDYSKHDPQTEVNGLIDDEWHHIVIMRRNGTDLRVYVDRVEDMGVTNHSESTIPADYDLSGTSQGNAHIGANWSFENQGVQKFFGVGLIDDVRVYNRALSVGEVNGLGGGIWPFDI